MAILSGINSTAVTRLKFTWNLVQQTPLFKIHQSLEFQMSSDKAFSTYRKLIKSAQNPCVPYLGVFLRDLLYIDESHKDMKTDGSLNLSKFLMIGDVILLIQSFQNRGYEGFIDPVFIKMLFSQTALDEEEAYTRSLELEPREA